jgi:hypothetical protein
MCSGQRISPENLVVILPVHDAQTSPGRQQRCGECPNFDELRDDPSAM